jgi:hypothetical protein
MFWKFGKSTNESQSSGKASKARSPTNKKPKDSMELFERIAADPDYDYVPSWRKSKVAKFFGFGYKKTWERPECCTGSGIPPCDAASQPSDGTLSELSDMTSEPSDMWTDTSSDMSGELSSDMPRECHSIPSERDYVPKKSTWRTLFARRNAAKNKRKVDNTGALCQEINDLIEKIAELDRF